MSLFGGVWRRSVISIVRVQGKGRKGKETIVFLSLLTSSSAWWDWSIIGSRAKQYGDMVGLRLTLYVLLISKCVQLIQVLLL